MNYSSRKDSWPTLGELIKAGKRHQLEDILCQDYSPDQVPYSKPEVQEALHVLLDKYLCDIEVLQWILDTGVSTNEPWPSDNTSALYRATLGHNIDAIQMLLDYGANPDSRDGKGMPVLHLAITRRLTDVISLLIQYGADVNLPDAECRVPLLYAILTDTKEIVDILLQAGSSVQPDKEVSQYVAPLIVVACKRGNVNIVSALISHGANSNEFDVLNTCMSALQVAVAYSHTSVVKLLLTAGSDPNFSNSSESAPLFLACRKGNLDITQCLIKHGANAYISNKVGQTPLHLASAHGLIHIVNALLQAGMDPDIPDFGGWTSLMIASECGSTDICETLLNFSADVDRKNDTGCTALFFAVSGGNEETARLLLKYGADPNTSDNSGFHALMMAVNINNSELIRQLVNHGADIDKYDSCHDNPLLLAVGLKHYDSVKSLLKLNANTEVFGPNGDTALSISLCNSDAKMFSILVIGGCNVKNFKQMDINALKLSPAMVIHIKEYAKDTSLMNIARSSIRKVLKCNFEEKIASLPVPECIKRFLLFSELDEISIDESPMELDD